jgi:endonuclease/exonuclease/phosphatase family metal-dependent hydrolase
MNSRAAVSPLSRWSPGHIWGTEVCDWHCLALIECGVLLQVSEQFRVTALVSHPCSQVLGLHPAALPRREGMRIDFVLGSPALAGRVTGALIDREERKGKGASDHAPVIVDLTD